MDCMPELFYNYVLIDPRNGFPIYVGKGKNGRMREHWMGYVLGKSYITKHHNSKLGNKLRKIASEGFSDVIYEKWFESEDEWFILWMEIYIIDFIGIENLCNITLGGDGVSGLKMSRKTCQKLSDRMKGKMSGDKNPMWGKPISEEHKYRLIMSHLGKKQSPETIEKRASRLRGRKRSSPMPDAQRQKLREAAIKQFSSEESRRRCAERSMGRKHSDETKSKMSESHLKLNKKGINSPLFGKSPSMETRKKRSESMTGLVRGPQSPDHKRKIIESKLGINDLNRNEIISESPKIRELALGFVENIGHGGLRRLSQESGIKESSLCQILKHGRSISADNFLSLKRVLVG